MRFRYSGAASLRSVSVAGTFNCWVADQFMLERISPTEWQTTLTLPPGRHHYKYVLDGHEYIADAANPWRSEDSQGNSCLTIDDQHSLMLRDWPVDATRPAPLHQRHAAVTSPAWLAEAVVYQLSVRSFGGTLARASARLDELQQLGVNLLWLMPLHPVGVQGRSGRFGDPYAVRDFLAIDATLGDMADLRAFTAAAHRRGMRVLYDWTLNRASIDNPLTCAHPDWFTRNGAGEVIYLVPGRSEFAGFDFSSSAARGYLIGAMQYWLDAAKLDGLRFDDADIVPLDFLDQIRAALSVTRPGVVLLARSCDELHHLAACDLTHDGSLREGVRRIADGAATAADLARDWNAATYSFPRGALRLRWLEEKEQSRAQSFLGTGLHHAAATVLLTMDGVPHLMMGQEIDQPGWSDWRVLFDGQYQVGSDAANPATLAHYQRLIALRRAHPALTGGSVTFVDTSAAQLLAYWRRTDAEQILVMVNLSPRACPLPPAAVGLRTLYAWPAQTDPSQIASMGSVVAWHA